MSRRGRRPEQRGLVPNYNGRCRSCDRDVVFAIDDRGTRQILDPKPITYLVETLERAPGGRPQKVAVVRTYPSDADELVGRALVSHFVTCPDASAWSKERSVAREDLDRLLDRVADFALVPDEPFDFSSAEVGEVPPASRLTSLIETAIAVSCRFAINRERLDRALASSKGRPRSPETAP